MEAKPEQAKPEYVVAILKALLGYDTEPTAGTRRFPVVMDGGLVTRSLEPDGEYWQEHCTDIDRAVAYLENFNPFTDAHADWLFAAGVLEKRLLNLPDGLSTPLVVVAARLYSNLLMLYPIWLDLMRVPRPEARRQEQPWSADVPEIPDASEPEDTEEKRRQELSDMVHSRLGLPKHLAVNPEEIVNELRRRELKLQKLETDDVGNA